MVSAVTNLYYVIKPAVPRRMQILLRRIWAQRRRAAYKDVWPIDERAKDRTPHWKGWPGKKRFALVLTHDVDTEKGQERCLELMEVDKRLGFRSSFNFVPEKYNVDPSIRKELEKKGFEVGVHGLNHDGKLYKSKSVFKERSKRINHYLKEWNAVGFRSPSMHHRLDWLHELDLEYDASTFDTDPFEPNPEGVGTIYPFWVGQCDGKAGYVELPYTLPQDFTVFVLMREESIGIWKRKVDWIAEQGGMALLNSHPDYMQFDGRKAGLCEYPVDYYLEFLSYLKREYEGEYWHVLPREMARYWTEEMN